VSVPPGIAISFEELLQATADAPGRPFVTDYGVPFAAAARTSARALDQDVYHGVHAKAAALLDTLLRHPWLEHHQASAALTAVSALLAFNNWRLREDVKQGELAALLTLVAGPGLSIAELARQLRDLSEAAAPGIES
jgi:hypothetical protein